MNMSAAQAVGQPGEVPPGSESKGGVPVDHSLYSTSGGSLPEYVVMTLLVECLKIHTNNLQVQADQLEANANEQNYWENEVKNIHNVLPPDTAKSAELQRDNAINQEKSAERSDDEDIIMTLSNQAHITMGQASSETNEVQQSMSVVSVVLQQVNSEADGIAKMTGQN